MGFNFKKVGFKDCIFFRFCIICLNFSFVLVLFFIYGLEENIFVLYSLVFMFYFLGVGLRIIFSFSWKVLGFDFLRKKGLWECLESDVVKMFV